MSPQSTIGGMNFLNGGGDCKVTLGWELEFLCPDDAGGGYCPTCDGDGYFYVECPSCNGNSELETDVECPGCDGRGYRYVYSSYNDREVEIDCPMCDGRGIVEVNVSCGCNNGEVRVVCPDCDGTGRRNSEYNYDISDVELYGELKEDSSIRTTYDTWGAEFASNVLYYGEDDITFRVKSVMSIINDCDGDSDPYRTCGLHVHVCPAGGWTLEHAARLARAWYNWAEEYFMNEFEPLERRMEYCQSWRDNNWRIIRQANKAIEYYNNKYEGFSATITDESTDEYRARAIKYLGVVNTRYVTLNFTAYEYHETVEFRLFNGTNDPDEVLKALDWVAKLVMACEAGSDGSKERFLQLIGRGTVVQMPESRQEELALAL